MGSLRSRPSTTALAVLVVGLYARRVAGRGIRLGRSRVDARRTVPGAEHLGALRALPGVVDGQGLVRPERTGPLELDAEFDPEVLRNVDVLKLAEDEARVLVGEPGEESLRSLGVPEVVVTLGSRGSMVLANDKLERVPAQPVPGKIDPTGAGDAFAAAYLVSRAGGHAPVAAARRATALVAGLLGRRLR